MTRRWIWLWPFSLASLLPLAVSGQAQDPDKDGPRRVSETRVIKDELSGSEPRDRVRFQAPYRNYDHNFVKGKSYLIDLESTDFDAYLRLEDPRGVQVAVDDDSGGNLNARISHTATETGTFRLIATGYGRDTRGKFTLTVREIVVREARPADLKLGESTKTIKDKVTASDGTDPLGRHYKAYEFAGQPAKLYRVELQGIDNALLRLLDDAGRVIRQSNSGAKGETTLTFRPKADGNYRLLVGSGQLGNTGDFQLSVTASVPREGKVTTIDPSKAVKIAGQLTSADGTDREGRYCRIFKFQAAAGKEYRFEARGPVDPRLRLENADGKRLQDENYGDTGYSHLSFRPSRTAMHQLVLSAGRPDQTGAFTLTGGDRLSLATHLVVGKEPTRVSDRLTGNDALDRVARSQKTYKFQGETGKIYRFEVTGDFAASLGVEPATTTFSKGGGMPPPPDFKDFKDGPIFIDDGPKGGPPGGKFPSGPPRRIYVPVNTGTHYLTVSAPSGQLGAYTLTASLMEAKLAKVTDPKYREVTTKVANLTGTLTEEEGINTSGQPYHLVALKTTPKKLYDIKLTVQPGMPMPQMRLEGPKGEILRHAQFGPNNALMLNYLATKPADNRIAIVGFTEQKTSYNLTITESEYFAPKVAVEKVVVSTGKPASVTKLMTEEATMPDGQPAQTVALKTAPKKMYDIRLTIQPGAPNPPQLRLEGLKGEVLRYAQFGPGNSLNMVYPATTSTEYRIAIIGFLDPNIPHRLTITESDYVPPKEEKLVVLAGKPTVVSNQLTLSDARGDINKLHKVYLFEGKQGKTYQIDLHSTAFDAYLYLKNNEGVTLSQNDDFGGSLDSRITFTMPKTGIYKVLATSLGGNETGPYTLTVQEIGGGPPK
ncbi:MAG TPA: PPC domain-containing protein [Gemmataceae bacterium]|nr:PPC domain-containing protein [Gemmataceae bacterium]